ncbi:MAG: phage capsid protein [bacterium]|nr:phage capsid protein [bacterium]
MADIDAGAIYSYERRTEMLLQQEDSRFEPYVFIPETATGKKKMIVEQYGQVEAAEVTQRYQAATFTEVPHDSRWVTPRDYFINSPVDEFDVQRRLTDPTGNYQKSQVAGIKRKQDDACITGFFADAMTGEDGNTTVTFAADGGQTVAVGSTGMTIDKMRSGKTNLRASEALEKGDMVIMAIAAQQHDDLMSQTQLINLDYASRPRLEDDEIVSFLGTKVIDSQRLALNASGHQRIPMWCKSGMALQKWKGVSVKVENRPDLVNTKQIKTIATFDATRLQGGKVNEIVCAIP